MIQRIESQCLPKAQAGQTALVPLLGERGVLSCLATEGLGLAAKALIECNTGESEQGALTAEALMRMHGREAAGTILQPALPPKGGGGGGGLVLLPASPGRASWPRCEAHAACCCC